MTSMKITRTSPFTQVTRTLDLPVSFEQMSRYINGGELLQNCFSHLSAGDREFIKTGITNDEWEKFFGDEVEE
jgi:hypothetical protein